MTIFSQQPYKLSTILWILLGTCLLSATLSGSVQAESVLLDKVIAIVNDDIVMQSEL